MAITTYYSYNRSIFRHCLWRDRCLRIQQRRKSHRSQEEKKETKIQKQKVPRKEEDLVLDVRSSEVSLQEISVHSVSPAVAILGVLIISYVI